MLKIEDLKTAYLKSEDSKYCFMCWEPPGCRVYEFIVAVVRYAQEMKYLLIQVLLSKSL